MPTPRTASGGSRPWAGSGPPDAPPGRSCVGPRTSGFHEKGTTRPARQRGHSSLTKPRLRSPHESMRWSWRWTKRGRRQRGSSPLVCSRESPLTQRECPPRRKPRLRPLVPVGHDHALVVEARSRPMAVLVRDPPSGAVRDSAVLWGRVWESPPQRQQPSRRDGRRCGIRGGRRSAGRCAQLGGVQFTGRRSSMAAAGWVSTRSSTSAR